MRTALSSDWAGGPGGVPEMVAEPGWVCEVEPRASALPPGDFPNIVHSTEAELLGGPRSLGRLNRGSNELGDAWLHSELLVCLTTCRTREQGALLKGFPKCTLTIPPAHCPTLLPRLYPTPAVPQRVTVTQEGWEGLQPPFQPTFPLIGRKWESPRNCPAPAFAPGVLCFCGLF